MRFQLRLVAALWIASLVVVGTFGYFQFIDERQRLAGELDRRAALLSDGLKEVLEPALARSGSKPQIDRLIKKFSKPDQGLAVYDRVASQIAATPDVAKQLENPPPEVTWALTSGAVKTGFRVMSGKTMYVYADPILRDDKPAGALAVFLDASALKTAEWELWRITAIRFLVLAVVLALMALLVVRMSLTQPLAKMARWTKAVRRGHTIDPPELPDGSLFAPIMREVSVLAKNLLRARAAAEEEAALRFIGQTLWTEERLKQFAKIRLAERPLVVVSNREPVSHVWKDGAIQALTPASGLVTAMDPVMRACGGTWVAHGSGDADRDDRGCARPACASPPTTRATPCAASGSARGGARLLLRLRQRGPLAAVPHRPHPPDFPPGGLGAVPGGQPEVRRRRPRGDRRHRVAVVLVQDYHFALLPGLIKDARPDPRVAIFWHIPWPNSRSSAICPWQDELLDGLLGADLIGFHTQYHCNNFLDTVDRALEARIDWERFAVTRTAHYLVKPFPISVDPRRSSDDAACRRWRAPRAAAARGACGTSGPTCPRRRRRPAWTTPRASRALPRLERLPRAIHPEYREQLHVRADRGAEPDAHRALPGVPRRPRREAASRINCALPDGTVEADRLS